MPPATVKLKIAILERDLSNDLSWYIWQDDGDKKHRTAHVLETLAEVFDERVGEDAIG